MNHSWVRIVRSRSQPDKTYEKSNHYQDILMVAGDRFCLSLGALGVQPYRRTSEQRASEKGASFHKRPSAQSVAPNRVLQLVCRLVTVPRKQRDECASSFCLCGARNFGGV